MTKCTEKHDSCKNGCVWKDEHDIAHNFYETQDISGDCCPKCGCVEVSSNYRISKYPDEWTQWNCARCGHLIAEIDNSPMVTCFEYEDFTIEY